VPLLSLRAYAKHCGVSPAAVQKAIHSGRISPNADGLIDNDRADAEWNAKTRPGQRRARPAATAPREPTEAPAAGLDYFRARAIRESYLVRLAKIEFEERIAKVVDREAESDEGRVHRILSAEIRKTIDKSAGANSGGGLQRDLPRRPPAGSSAAITRRVRQHARADMTRDEFKYDGCHHWG
jgi:hypothetical protein